MNDSVTSLQAQLASVTALLSELDAEDVARISLEERVTNLRASIAAALRRADVMADVSLLFRGRPVSGSRGMDATFAGKAVEGFQKLVSKMAASRQGRAIKTTGRIPGSADSRLLLSGTLPGSFGLVLREHPPEREHPLFKTELAHTVDATVSLLADAALSDEAFADASIDVEPAVLQELGGFLELLAKNDATLRANTETVHAALDDDDTIAAAHERVAVRTTRELDLPVRGKLMGVLPDARRFEFESETGEKMSGKIGPAVDAVGALSLVLKPCEARLTLIEIERRGATTKRYVMRDVAPV